MKRKQLSKVFVNHNFHFLHLHEVMKLHGTSKIIDFSVDSLFNAVLIFGNLPIDSSFHKNLIQGKIPEMRTYLTSCLVSSTYGFPEKWKFLGC